MESFVVRNLTPALSLSRSIVALLLVFLIGSPLCCCAAEGCSKDAGPARHSCCEKSATKKHGDPSPKEHVCHCKSKDPRDLAKAPELSHDPGIPLPAEIFIAVTPPAEVPRIFVAAHFFPGSDPPRTRLARLARWLI
ncbi:hypothetical protein [Haloferula sargassicola]|uniref:Secreted protein n=1 Tax=Haloferula sargassicola TaxID=490096 RepID=A0ABP9US06_9BACT